MQLARQKCPGSYYLYFHNLERDTLNDHEWKRFLQLKIKGNPGKETLSTVPTTCTPRRLSILQMVGM